MSKAAAVMALLFTTLPGSAWNPGAAQSNTVGSPAVPLVVDIDDRNDVVSFYQCIYKASDDFATHMNWTGDVDACTPGTTAAVFKDDVRRRVNWFRAMTGIPADIVFDSQLNSDAQAAALIMSEHGALSHTPGASFGMTGCWTQAGDDAAGNGNLALGSYGANAIDGYIEDAGSNNRPVGHRRWILYPRVTTMGTGDIPSSGNYPYIGGGEHWASNCLYVIDSASYRAGIGEFVSWPPPGFVPATTTWARWSLQFNESSGSTPTFGSASVTMTRVSDSTNIPVDIVYTYTGGGLAGDPAITWEPDWSAFGGTPPLESPIEVTVSGIAPGSSGAPTSHTYQVTVIDPETITDPIAVSGPTNPPSTGATYTFAPLTGVGADSYDVGVSAKLSTAWTEGAEDPPTPQIIDSTSASYDLRTNLTNGPGNFAGSRVFHLTIPSFAEVVQTFEVDRDIIPTAAGTLQFQELFRYATTVSRLSAQISTDDGNSWTELWGRNGNGSGSSANWDQSWNFHNISLAAYADQPIRLRFQYTAPNTGPAFTGTSTTRGAFVDEITVTNSLQLGTEQITALSGTSTGFTLDATTAGGPLEVDANYLLRVRPVLGCKTFGFDTPLEVTITDPPTFSTWMATNHPSVTPNGPFDDPDGDHMGSVVEFALGTDPGVPDCTPPGITIIDGQMTYSIDTDTLAYPVPGITYGAQSSTDLDTWIPIPDTGSGTTHTFTFPTGSIRNFIRWAITLSP